MKNIPVALQTHYDKPVNTTCLLLRVQRQAAFDGDTPAPIGMTTLDRDVVYNDGNGAITYSALAGFVESNLLATADMGVDNAEAQVLIPAYDLGPLIESEINAGLYDSARFRLYKLNYHDLTSGRHEILMAGTVGQPKVVGGLSCFAELRGINQRFKQPVCEKDSDLCRSRFGSQVGEEHQPCEFDTSGMWSSFTVDTPGGEPDRQFTAVSLGVADGYYFPGFVRWTSGANTGRTDEIQSQLGNAIELRFRTAFNIEAGDEGEIRQDCSKRWDDADHGCLKHWGSLRALHFDGEPHTPVADEAVLATPGGAKPSPNSVFERIHDFFET